MLLIRTAVAAIGRIGSNRVGRRRRGKVVIIVMMQIGRSSSIAIALRGAPLLINGHGRRGAIAAVIMILMHSSSSRRWGIKQVPRDIRIVATAAAAAGGGFARRHETGRIARVQPLTDDGPRRPLDTSDTLAVAMAVVDAINTAISNEAARAVRFFISHHFWKI